MPAIDANFYFGLKPENNMVIEEVGDNKDEKNGELNFHINCFTSIPSKMVTKVIAVAYKDRHPGFAKCYKLL